MTFLRLMLIFVGISTASVSLASIEVDSLRLEKRDDGTFIIHRVESGETLFSLAKRYGADLAKIAEVNKLDGYSINIGQILEIPHTVEPKIVKNDKSTYHTVKKGETLYAISHIYGVKLYDLKEWNDLKDNAINEGQILMVAKDARLGSSTTTANSNSSREVTTTNNTETTVVESGKTHKVKAGETLYAISRQYNVPVDQLRKLNNMSDNNISVDQVLIIAGGSSSVTETTNNTTDSNTEISSNQNSSGNTTTTVPTQTSNNTEVTDNTEVVKVDSVQTNEKRKRFGNSDTPREPGEFNKVFEKGMAMRIENSPKTKKYLCLHRTLPIGAIMQVRNLMNNQSIFVRVVGTLPEIGGNESVLIRLSDIAYQRLGALDAKFPVEISYIPE